MKDENLSLYLYTVNNSQEMLLTIIILYKLECTAKNT